MEQVFTQDVVLCLIGGNHFLSFETIFVTVLLFNNRKESHALILRSALLSCYCCCVSSCLVENVVSFVVGSLVVFSRSESVERTIRRGLCTPMM